MANYSNVSMIAWQRYSECRSQYGPLTERDEAALFAQFIEIQLLKAPATAIFAPFNEMIVNGSNGNYRVSGYVDSQNSYGAMIRTQFSYNICKNMYGQWVCNDHFVDTTTQVTKHIVGGTIIWWILGILFTLISTAISFIFISDIL